VLPHSRGEIVLTSADFAAPPTIRMNYYDDPHDLKVMVAAIRRAMDIAAHWPGNRKPGPAMIPPFLAEKHGYREGDEPSDALLEDLPFITRHPPAGSAMSSTRGCGCSGSAGCGWRTPVSCRR
jgi:hypothetical protein